MEDIQHKSSFSAYILGLIEIDVLLLNTLLIEATKHVKDFKIFYKKC
jgi:hypothetical protein